MLPHDMIRVQLRPEPAAKKQKYHIYQIAQETLQVDIPIPELAAFESNNALNHEGYTLRVETSGGVNGEYILTYAGPGWIANRWRSVQCWSDGGGYKLKVEGGGSFAVASNGGAITALEIESDTGSPVILETILGPLLILALAIKGTWCFHASAVSLGNKCVAFLAESGLGKSTMAKWLGEDEESDWSLAADDILPVNAGLKTFDALPRFPQLKLPFDGQPGLDEQERLPLTTLYTLNPAPSLDAPIEIVPLSQSEALLALVRHTVAARLFNKELLVKHLDFCGQVCGRIRVRQLNYPRKFDLLPKVRDILSTDVTSLANKSN